MTIENCARAAEITNLQVMEGEENVETTFEILARQHIPDRRGMVLEDNCNTVSRTTDTTDGERIIVPPSIGVGVRVRHYAVSS